MHKLTLRRWYPNKKIETPMETLLQSWIDIFWPYLMAPFAIVARVSCMTKYPYIMVVSDSGFPITVTRTCRVTKLLTRSHGIMAGFDGGSAHHHHTCSLYDHISSYRVWHWSYHGGIQAKLTTLNLPLPDLIVSLPNSSKVGNFSACYGRI